MSACQSTQTFVERNIALFKLSACQRTFFPHCSLGCSSTCIIFLDPRLHGELCYKKITNLLFCTESCFRHPLFDLRGTRKVEIRHTNFHFSSKKVTSKSRKVEGFDLTIVKKLSTFRPKKAKVEKLKSRKVEKLKN